MKTPVMPSCTWCQNPVPWKTMIEEPICDAWNSLTPAQKQSGEFSTWASYRRYCDEFCQGLWHRFRHPSPKSPLRFSTPKRVDDFYSSDFRYHGLQEDPEEGPDYFYLCGVAVDRKTHCSEDGMMVYTTRRSL